jgi:FkbM family methyltransferase
VHLSQGEAFNLLAQTRYGPMLYNRNDHYVGGSLAAYGEFSEGEADLFRQLLRPGATVVEAGANIGAHTILLARLAGEQGVIHAFEPQRLVFQTLCANLALNQCVNVRAYQQGVGGESGRMVVPSLDPRQSHNFGGLSLAADGPGENVRIVTVDSLELDQCALIKADVEGMEEAVLAGAALTISRCRPILFLENDRKEKSAALLGRLLSMGYRIWWHLSPLFNPDNHARNPVNIFGGIISINILCQPAEAARPVNGLREIRSPDDDWQRPAA